MNNFIPDIYARNIYNINYDKLKERNIKCLLIDLDNTMVLSTMNSPTKELENLFIELEDMGFKIIIISNCSKKRLTIFKEKLNVDTAYLSFKPFKMKYKKIMKIYSYKQSEIAAIGDQILTDILGANRMGITSIFVDKLGEDTFIGTKINRFFERIILNKLNKRGIYEEGKFYE